MTPRAQAGNGDYPAGYCPPIPVPVTPFQFHPHPHPRSRGKKFSHPRPHRVYLPHGETHGESNVHLVEHSFNKNNILFHQNKQQHFSTTNNNILAKHQHFSTSFHHIKQHIFINSTYLQPKMKIWRVNHVSGMGNTMSSPSPITQRVS